MLSNYTRKIGFGALVLLFAAGSAFATTYKVDTQYSAFEVQNDIRPVKGTFDHFEGQIVYEPAQVEDSSIEFRAKAKSFKVENDNIVMGAALFFNLDKHPEIRFKSSKVEAWGNRLMVTGSFSMLGITRVVRVPVQVLGRGTDPKTGLPIAGFAADMQVKLSDLGVDTWTNATGILGDTLNIRLKMVGVENDTQALTKLKSPERL
ncbi:MAG: polyisoprenoid-binding protein [Candidatus Latescibacteria bacterium]|jgi:polyisoprenoid-binding protein YceI|nr:polyisoprenoid-binding protein [Candidatus Latescibacterota bacterium]